MLKKPSLVGIALASALVMSAAAATVSAQDTGAPLMTPQEQQAHEEKLRSMSPAEREAYRDEQYRLLRERAVAHGLKLPADPPWKTFAGMGAPTADAAPTAAAETEAQPSATADTTEPPVPADAAARQAEAEARHAEMVQQHEAMRQAAEARHAEMAKQAEERRAEAQAGMAGGPGVSPEEMTQRREAMRQEAEARHAEMTKQAEERRAEAQAGMAGGPGVSPEEMAQRREAMRQEAEARYAEMAKQAEERRAEMPAFPDAWGAVPPSPGPYGARAMPPAVSPVDMAAMRQQYRAEAAKQMALRQEQMQQRIEAAIENLPPAPLGTARPSRAPGPDYGYGGWRGPYGSPYGYGGYAPGPYGYPGLR